MLMAVPTTGRRGSPFWLFAGAIRKARTCEQQPSVAAAAAAAAAGKNPLEIGDPEKSLSQEAVH
jgi:hypothetical protein